MDDREIGLRIPAGTGNFALFHSVQTGSGVHPASYLMDIGDTITDKAAEA
jgi:hypothetical protein